MSEPNIKPGQKILIREHWVLDCIEGIYSSYVVEDYGYYEENCGYYSETEEYIKVILNNKIIKLYYYELYLYVYDKKIKFKSNKKYTNTCIIKSELYTNNGENFHLKIGIILYKFIDLHNCVVGYEVLVDNKKLILCPSQIIITERTVIPKLKARQ